MLVQLPYFLLGLLLLWFPRRWMRFGAVLRRRRKSTHRVADEPWRRRDPGDPRLSAREEFGKARNYFDLLRGLAGSLAIMGGFGIVASLTPAPGSGRLVANQVFALQIALLLVGLAIQTIRIEHGRLSFFAPIFYLAGLSVAFCGPWAALFAFCLVWSVNAMFGSAQAFMAVYAVLLAGFGILFRWGSLQMAIVPAVLCLLPVLASLLTRRRLGAFTRKATQTQGS
jgi:hypothetical protein